MSSLCCMTFAAASLKGRAWCIPSWGQAPDQYVTKQQHYTCIAPFPIDNIVIHTWCVGFNICFIVIITDIIF